MKPGDLIKLKEGPAQIREKIGKGIFLGTNSDIPYESYSMETIIIQENALVLLLEMPKDSDTDDPDSSAFVKILVKDKVCLIKMSHIENSP